MLKRLVMLATLLVIPKESWSATATAVSLSAVSRAANVVTVTCSAACNIAAGKGFSISGVTDASFNTNGTAVTGSGTSFTFNQTGVTASSSGGSVLPAKQVVVLIVSSVPNFTNVSAICWLSTTAGIVVSNGSNWTGASASENNAIKAGTTLEQSLSVSYPSTYSAAQIQSDLQARCNGLQATLAAGVQPGSFYGGFYDGAGWSF